MSYKIRPGHRVGPYFFVCRGRVPLIIRARHGLSFNENRILSGGKSALVWGTETGTFHKLLKLNKIKPLPSRQRPFFCLPPLTNFNRYGLKLETFWRL